MPGGRWPAALVVLVVVLLAATRPWDAGRPDRAPGGPAIPRIQLVGPRQASEHLAQLREVARHPGGPAYRRDAFGSPWDDVDGNGCNQRDDVLLRDGVRGTLTVGEQGACDHDVLAGTWRDPYTGRRIVLDDLKDPRQAQAVQIDHVVPLAEAWISGASSWTAVRRHRFANDLGELLAVDGPANASKSDGDPAAWRPRKAYQCRYAVHWVAIKWRWRLDVDDSERRALTELLGTC